MCLLVNMSHYHNKIGWKQRLTLTWIYIHKIFPSALPSQTLPILNLSSVKSSWRHLQGRCKEREKGGIFRATGERQRERDAGRISQREKSPQRSSVSLCIRTLSSQTRYLFKVSQFTREQRKKSKVVLWNKALHFLNTNFHKAPCFTHVCILTLSHTIPSSYTARCRNWAMKAEQWRDAVLEFLEINKSACKAAKQ